MQKGELLPLLTLRTAAIEKKQHPYELLKLKDLLKVHYKNSISN